MLRKLLPILSVKILQIVYFACFIFTNYSIIFCGSSSSMRNIFIIQKTEIGIMLGLGPISSFRESFKQLDILKVPCLYILTLMLFAAKNFNIYQTNTYVHGMNTRQQNKLHIPLVRHSSMQRGIYSLSFKIFNQLLQNIFKFYNSIHIF
jgi:hypothetical protein